MARAHRERERPAHASLHRAGLLHGDVKPANIIVGEEGAATLVDLGLAAPWREGGTARARAHAEVRRARAVRGRAAHRARRGVRARRDARRGARAARRRARPTTRASRSPRSRRARPRRRARRALPERRRARERAPARGGAAAEALARASRRGPCSGSTTRRRRCSAQVRALAPGAALAVLGARGLGAHDARAARSRGRSGVEGRPVAIDRGAARRP